MKKFLLTTTALLAVAGVASAAEPLTVKVGGSFKGIAGYVSEDRDTNLRELDFKTDTSVIVTADGVADNGLAYGAKIELEGDQTSDVNSDEAVMYLSGSWGRFEFGDEDGAADRLSYTAPGKFALGGAVGDVGESSYRDFASAPAGSAVSIAAINRILTAFEARDSDDATKVTYFSPRFSGFQVGVSYIPEFGNQGTSTARTEVTGTTAYTYDGQVEDAFEVAANYVGEFNEVGVAFSAAYVSGETVNTIEDLSSYNLGLNLTYQGFTFGGGYTSDGDSTLTKTLANNADDSLHAWTVGLQYETGPYVVGINYLDGSAEGNTADVQDVDASAVSIGGTYVVAPGLSTFAELTMFDKDVEGNTNDNDGSVFIIGSLVEF